MGVNIVTTTTNEQQYQYTQTPSHRTGIYCVHISGESNTGLLGWGTGAGTGAEDPDGSEIVTNAGNT